MKFLFVAFMAAIICSLSLTSNAQSHNNAYEIDVTHKSAAPHPGKQILFICLGNMSSRKVAEDLQYQLNKCFKKYQITTTFEFFSTNDSIPTTSLIALAAKHPHDVVLLFTPQSVYDTITIWKPWSIVAPDWRIAHPKTRSTTHQTTFLTLFADADFSVPFWAANIEIWTDLSKAAMYKELAKDLVARWEDIRLIVKGA